MTKKEISKIATEAAVSALSGYVMEQPKKGESLPAEGDVEGEPEEECHCDNLKPMEEWFGEDDKDSEQCHECLALPIAEYYLGALEQEKAEPQIKQLREAWATDELSKIGKAMDEIKSEVGESLKKRLLNYDCYAQTFEMPEDAEDEAQQED